ncbi:hypothetical protein K1719_038512 [Acacia pycnantha]|nr:hypothetical protein K1719_038512 [Acacia pycnantha]
MWLFGNRDRQTPAKAPRRLNPSDAVLKHLGKDIVKKSQQRKKYLFSFPGHIAPIGHDGWIGDLKNLGRKNPVLYVDFLQSKLLFPKEDMQEVTVEPEPNTGGDADDEKAHREFHKTYTPGLPFKGWTNERAIHMPNIKGGRVILVLHSDPVAQKNKECVNK